jgi:hypothetical protein
MEEALSLLEKALAFVLKVVTSGNEPLVLGAAGGFFVLGLLLLYKKGPKLGLPISLAGILLMAMAIFSKFFNRP